MAKKKKKKKQVIEVKHKSVGVVYSKWTKKQLNYGIERMTK